MCHAGHEGKARTGLSRIGIALGLLAWAAPAFAQTPEQSGVVPPLIDHHHAAVYPAAELAAKKHAEVTLFVTIDAEGHVTQVDVAQSGGKPFDDAAMSAMHEWTFVPAKRDGKAIAARIRVPFHFAPPEAPADGEILAPGIRGQVVQQPDAPPPSANGKRLGSSSDGVASAAEVRVEGSARSPSRGSSDFRISRKLLDAAPHGSAADLLSTAPGVFVAHPEGEAVAQRVYLRGFDADHGQDIEFKVSGIPMNQSSHIHGQGYADLNLIIPEAVKSIRVLEGVYDPHQGDFAVAGSVEYELGVEERRPRIKLSQGSFGTQRVLALWAPTDQADETFAAATFRRTDGFGNGTRGGISGGMLGQYKLSLPNNIQGLLHIGAYGARSNIAGVLRRDDVESGRVGFYDAYGDPSARSQSAGSSRTQVGLSFTHTADAGARTTAGVWLYLANFRSRMNYTGYTERSRFDPTWVGRGDLIEQSNEDLGLGGSFSYRSSRLKPLSWLSAQYELGTDVRTHRISQAQNLLRAPQNETWDQRDNADLRTTDIGLYADVLFNVTRHVKLRGGARADLLFFDVDDKLGNFIPAFSKKTHILGFRRTANGIAFGPRATLEATATSWLRLSASYGEGYRSPQARQLEEGEQAPFAKVRSYEVGATVQDGDRIALTGIFYETDLSYDLAFDPRQGRLERLGPTTRRGAVAHFLANPADWMTASLSATYVYATLDSPPIPTPENPTPPYVAGQSLPYVPPLVLRSDVGFQGSFGALFGEPLQWKVGFGTTFLSSRPLPYSQFSPPVFLLDATAGVRRDWLELSLDGTNLLGARYADTEYAFASNWLSSPVPSRVPARHIAAGAPRVLMANLTFFL